MALDWKAKLSELRSALSGLADQGPADVLKNEGESIAKQLEAAGKSYDRQSSPIPATADSLSAVVAELDGVAALVDGDPPNPTTFAAAQARLVAAKSGANDTETAILNRALSVSEPGESTSSQSSGVQKGTEQVYRPQSRTHETVKVYYTRGELEESLLENISAANEWLTLVGGL